MRNTLLVAAATLAAGIISSQAAGVYSQNIVGYVNSPMLGNAKFNMVTPPFAAGVSNGLNEVFGTGLPDGTLVWIFNGTGYTTYGYDSTIGADPRNSYDGGFSVVGIPLPSVPPGTGMFVQLPPGSNPTTNTYVGAVLFPEGTTNSLSLPYGKYSFVGSPLPTGGDITYSAINLVPPDQTLVSLWNPTNTTFVTYGYDSTIGADTNNWYDGGFSVTSPTPQLNVGQGFFIVPGGFGTSGTYVWKQTF